MTEYNLTTREARILHLGQVVVDLSMNFDHLPERGGDIFARRSAIKVGCGYNVIYAARQMGAPIAYKGRLAQVRWQTWPAEPLPPCRFPLRALFLMIVIPDIRSP